MADFHSLTSYLDAFLSSGRSVTFLLQKEFSDKNGFRTWYDAKVKSIDPEEDFSLFNELRTTSVHERNVFPNTKVSATSSIHFTTSFSVKQYDKNGNLIKEVTGGSDRKELPKLEGTKITRSWFFSPRPNDDAISLCERYYSKLKEIVDECEKQFPANI